MEEISKIEELEEQDRILFNDRARPLKVAECKKDSVLLEGPLGGRYQLFEEENADHLLVSKPGDREYASYAKDLRRTGEWIETDKGFEHTDTEASVHLVRNDSGFWSLKVSDLDADFDIPKYGFSDKEYAEEEMKKIVENNPEG